MQAKNTDIKTFDTLSLEIILHSTSKGSDNKIGLVTCCGYVSKLF